MQISARTPSLPDRPRHRGAAQGADSLRLAEPQHRSVGRVGLGQWRGWARVSGEGGSGSVERAGLGQWGGWVWVSGEGGSGSVERVGLGQWRGWVWVSGEGGPGSVERVGLGQWGGWVWVSGEGGLAAASLSEDEKLAQTALLINTASLAIFLTAT